MPTRLVWSAHAGVSCWHTVAALAAGRATLDDALTSELALPALALAELVEEVGVARGDFFEHLVPLAASIAGPRDLAQIALTKCLGRERAMALAEPIGAALAALRQRHAALRPELEAELALRRRPIDEQWHAYGGGLLLCIGRLTEAELLVEEAQVALVEPVCGGGGTAYPPYNLLTLEAVLVNPLPQVLEVLRLAWLLAQLNLDLPRYADHLPRARLRRAAQLALVPIVMSAGEMFDLAPDDDAIFGKAIAGWGLSEPGDTRVAQIVIDWREVYSATRPGFAAALVALDQMLEATL